MKLVAPKQSHTRILVYKPEYKETKYFLTHFCQLYYRRNRSTINDDFSQALYFLDGRLASDTIQIFKKKAVIKSFLTDSLAPEKDIDVQQVVIEPMDKPPFKATVDFYEIEYSPADHSVMRKTLYTASFLFSFRDHVPNQDILVNPLGTHDHLFPRRPGVPQMNTTGTFTVSAARSIPA